MKKVAVLSIPLMMILFCSSFNYKAKEKINWLSLQEFQVAYAKEPKPVLVDLYTSWCGWCKVMDRDTYSKENVATYINQHYYAVKFNAESRDSVSFGGKKYGYNTGLNANGLAVYLAFGQMAYPTTVFLSGINDQPAPIPGFLSPADLEPPLKYFGDGAYKTKTFPEFMQSFTKSW